MYNKIQKTYLLVQLILSFGIFSANADERCAIVVSQKSQIVLDQAKIKEILLGFSQETANGVRVRLINHSETSHLYRLVYKKFTKKSLAEVKAHWSYMVFTGKATSPKMLSDPKEIIRLLLEDHSVVSYLPESMIDPRLKVLIWIEDDV